MGSLINSPGVGSLGANGDKIYNGNVEFVSGDGTIVITVDPVTKEIDLSATGAAGGAFPYKPHSVTLSDTDIANKFIQLPEIAAQPSKVRLTVLKGTEQVNGEDFLVSGDVVSWNGTPLEPLLATNDQLIIIYT